jgi:hypothetical protein
MSPNVANFDGAGAVGGGGIPARTFRLGALSFPRSVRAGDSGGEPAGFAPGVLIKREEEVRYEDDLDEDLMKARKTNEVAIDVV